MSSEARARHLIPRRSSGLCEVRIPEVCQGRGASLHHRRKRSQGGTWSCANIVHTCGSGTTGCHGWIEANPAAAHQWGLTLRAGEMPERPTRLVWRGIPAFWRLADDCTITWLFDS